MTWRTIALVCRMLIAFNCGIIGAFGATWTEGSFFVVMVPTLIVLAGQCDQAADATFARDVEIMRMHEQLTQRETEQMMALLDDLIADTRQRRGARS